MSYPSQGCDEDEAEQRSDNNDITAIAVNLVVFKVCYLSAQPTEQQNSSESGDHGSVQVHQIGSLLLAMCSWVDVVTSQGFPIFVLRQLLTGLPHESAPSLKSLEELQLGFSGLPGKHLYLLSRLSSFSLFRL